MVDKTRSTIREKRITVFFENQKLYKTLKAAAAQKGMSIQRLINEAVKEYLRKQEDFEDLHNAINAAKEPRRSWDEFIKEVK